MTSMAMNKSGNLGLTTNNAWVLVTGWVARSGYGSTVITGNRLVLDQSGTGDITFRGQFATASGTQEFRVVKNGATTPVVVAGPAVLNTIVTVPGVTVNAGDTLELQAWASSSFSDTVTGGATATYLIYDQTSQGYTLDTSPTTVLWTLAAVANIGRTLEAALTVTWSSTASVGLDVDGDTAPTVIDWDATADVYQGQHYTGEAASTWNWNSEASILLTPKIVAPPSVFSFADIAVSVHTIDGRAVGDIPCEAIATYRWGREDTEVSTASLDVLTQADPELMEELRQWIHWITIWHDDNPVWTGPIKAVRLTRSITTITARDPAVFLWATRVPLSRTFTDTAPARIASVLWQAMNSHHGIRTTPFVLPGIVENTFTIAATADSRMLHQLMADLVNVGLHWSVVSGRPVLGEFSRQPVAELYECDFTVELERLRDGSMTFNDVRVQGQNWAQSAVAELAGLKLQTLVSMDDLFGASNIQRAAQQYAKDVATLRDELVIPPNASLHPQAPVTMDDLMPGKTFAVHYENISQLMRLDAMEVSGSPESFDVQVTLVALKPETEIAQLVGGSDS